MRGKWSNQTHQRTTVCPAELILYFFVIKSNPLVVLCVGFGQQRHKQCDIKCKCHLCAQKQLLTVNKQLLLLGADADQVSVELLTALLCLRPGVSLREVEVTAAHKLHPALSTALYSYTNSLYSTFSAMWCERR